MQLLLTQVHGRPQDHHGHDLLAEALIGNADHGGLGDRRVGVQHVWREYVSLVTGQDPRRR